MANRNSNSLLAFAIAGMFSSQLVWAENLPFNYGTAPQQRIDGVVVKPGSLPYWNAVPQAQVQPKVSMMDDALAKIDAMVIKRPIQAQSIKIAYQQADVVPKYREAFPREVATEVPALTNNPKENTIVGNIPFINSVHSLGPQARKAVREIIDQAKAADVNRLGLKINIADGEDHNLAYSRSSTIKKYASSLGYKGTINFDGFSVDKTNSRNLIVSTLKFEPEASLQKVQAKAHTAYENVRGDRSRPVEPSLDEPPVPARKRGGVTLTIDDESVTKTNESWTGTPKSAAPLSEEEVTIERALQNDLGMINRLVNAGSLSADTAQALRTAAIGKAQERKQKIYDKIANQMLSQYGVDEKSLQGPSVVATEKQCNWIISPDQGTVMNALDAWAKKANWTVLWEHSRDYPIVVGARFCGDFASAIDQLMGAITQSDPIRVRLYSGNHVVRVTSAAN